MENIKEIELQKYKVTIQDLNDMTTKVEIVGLDSSFTYWSKIICEEKLKGNIVNALYEQTLKSKGLKLINLEIYKNDEKKRTIIEIVR